MSLLRIVFCLHVVAVHCIWLPICCCVLHVASVLLLCIACCLHVVAVHCMLPPCCCCALHLASVLLLCIACCLHVVAVHCTLPPCCCCALHLASMLLLCIAPCVQIVAVHYTLRLRSYPTKSLPSDKPYLLLRMHGLTQAVVSVPEQQGQSCRTPLLSHQLVGT